MADTHDPDLEAAIHRALCQLPERPAPAQLIPRVLAAMEERTRRWWRRPWLSWPRPAQAISASFLFLMISTAGYVSHVLSADFEAEPMAGNFLQQFPLLDTLWGFCAALLNGLLALLRAEQTWLLYGLVLVLLMYLLCVALGTLCFRMAFNQRPNS